MVGDPFGVTELTCSKAALLESEAHTFYTFSIPTKFFSMSIPAT